MGAERGCGPGGGRGRNLASGRGRARAGIEAGFRGDSANCQSRPVRIVSTSAASRMRTHRHAPTNTRSHVQAHTHNQAAVRANAPNCTVLHCDVPTRHPAVLSKKLPSSAVHRAAQECKVLHLTAPHPQSHLTALHCAASTALRYTAQHCLALHCTTLHCTALHCTALHDIALYTIVIVTTTAVVAAACTHARAYACLNVHFKFCAVLPYCYSACLLLKCATLPNMHFSGTDSHAPPTSAPTLPALARTHERTHA